MEPMLQLIKDFPEQLRSAADLCRNWSVSPVHAPKDIVVCGMGGSGIAGKIIASVFSGELSAPMTVVQDYRLPNHCTSQSLVIVSSYSGNTEESITCFLDAIERGIKPVCLSSGGNLADLCRRHDCHCLSIPGGFPPRSQFGYGFVGILHILASYHLIGKDIPAKIDIIANKIRELQSGISAESASLAGELKNRTVCLYAEPRYLSVALRWRQQLNENSKMLCLCEAIPEMNHNELVGWGAAGPDYAAVFLCSGDAHPRIKKRFDISKALIEKRTPAAFNVSYGETDALTTTLYFVHFGDWLSWHLAEKRGFDPVAIPEIEFLKTEMGR